MISLASATRSALRTANTGEQRNGLKNSRRGSHSSSRPKLRAITRAAGLPIWRAPSGCWKKTWPVGSTRPQQAKSRQHELERSIEELLVFLRRAQQHFEGKASEPVRSFGPLELRSQRRSAARRDRLSRLFRDIGEWVSRHRDELIAMIETASTTSVQQDSLPSDTSSSPRGTEDLSIDVIVCVHDSLAQVRRCLESVIPTISGRRHTLIIVDDGSDDDTADFLRTLRKRSRPRQTHSAGNRRGIHQSGKLRDRELLG